MRLYFRLFSKVMIASGLMVGATVALQAQMPPAELAISYLDACLETTDYAARQQDEAERDSSRFVAMSALTSRLETECLSTPLGYCEVDGLGDTECLDAARSEISGRATEILNGLPEEISGTGFEPRSYKRRLEAARQGPSTEDNCQAPATFPETYCQALGSAMHLYSVRVLKRMVQRNSSENGDN